MVAKQQVPRNKKDGEITRSERTTANQQVESLLENVKQKTGKVVLIAITPRTTIELPAHLSQEEINARVENYIRLHKSKI